MDIWRAISKQHGVTLVGNFQELIDQVTAFTFLSPITGRRLIIIGGGGGKSVVSADMWEEEGFHLPPLSVKVRKELKKEAPAVWDWLRNPLDSSILQKSPAAPVNLLRMIVTEQEFDVFVVGLTQDDFSPTDIWRETLARDFVDGSIAIKEERKPVLCVIETGEIGLSDMKSWRWSAIADIRKQIVSQGIPVFPSPARAAKALRKFIDYWIWRERR
jgi:acyl-CoA synthetase (NDP forming)